MKTLKTPFLLNTSRDYFNFKTTGFTEAVMQMNFWIVKIYFISTFLVLVGIFLFIFGECKLSFYIWTALWLKKYDVFYFSPDNTIELSRDILGRAPSSWVSTLPSFGGHGPCECADKTFLICHMTTWMICHVTLLVGFPYRNLPLAKFGIGLLKVEILSFDLSRDHSIEMSHYLMGGVPLS